MLFQYVGDAAAPRDCDIFDYHFVLNGEPVDVTDAKAIKKLIGNKTFKHEPLLIASVEQLAAFADAAAEREAIADETVLLSQVTPKEPTAEVIHLVPVSERVIMEGDGLPETFCDKILARLGFK